MEETKDEVKEVHLYKEIDDEDKSLGNAEKLMFGEEDKSGASKTRASMEDLGDDDGPEEDESGLETETDISFIQECTHRDKEYIENYLAKHYKEYDYPEYFFSENCNMDKPELWDTAKLRVCVCFFSPGNVRSVSNTPSALLNWKENNYADNVFMDFSSVPWETDFQRLVEADMPVMFGNVSHRPLQDYDVLFFSNSIFTEVLNIPRVMKQVGIPLSTEERDRTKAPIIMMGGASAPIAHIVTGPISDNPEDGTSLIDAGNYGPIEGTGHLMMSTFLEYMDKGGVKENREQVLIDLATKYEYYYVPKFYKQVVDPEHNLRIVRTEKLIEGLPRKIKFSKPVDISNQTFARKAFWKTVDSADSADIIISQGCSGFNCCRFCHEGSISGPFRSKSVDLIQEDINKTKEWSAPNSVGFFSFNLNFHPQIKTVVGKLGENFSQISLVTMRTDEISEDLDMMNLAKMMGQIRTSMAVEGMGERVRNKIFNKNLSRAQLMKAARNVFNQRYIMLKLPMVISGQETEADMDEFLGEIQEMIDIRNSMGATTAITMSFTPLVIYDQTALRWMPRITAKASFDGIKTMMYFAERLRPMDARAKYHAKGPGTFIEQLLLDTHRQGTRMLVDATINQGLAFTRNFNLAVKDILLKSCDKFGIDYMDIFRERDLNEELPSDVFEYVTDETVEAWKEMHQSSDFSAKYCLKTKSSEGHCYGCKTCPTVEAIKNVTQRNLETTTFDDVMNSLRMFKPVFYTKIVCETKGCCQIHNKEALAHYITSLFLRRDTFLRDNYHSMGHTTSEWTGAEGQKDWFTGKLVWDMKWITPIDLDKLTKLIDDINNSGDLVDCKILAIRESSKETCVKRGDFVSYIIRMPEMSAQKFQEKVQNFNGQMRVFDLQTGPTLKGFKWKRVFDDKMSERLCAANKGTDLYIGMVIPIYYSPYAVLASLTGTSYEKLVRGTDVIVLDHFKQADMVCDTCGKPMCISSVDNKLRCPACANKKVVYKLTRL